MPIMSKAQARAKATICRQYRLNVFSIAYPISFVSSTFTLCSPLPCNGISPHARNMRAESIAIQSPLPMPALAMSALLALGVRFNVALIDNDCDYAAEHNR